MAVFYSELTNGLDVVSIDYRVAPEHPFPAALEDAVDAYLYLCERYPAVILTGDSAGGHLALYMAEASEDASLPIRPKSFRTRGVMLNCPAYDFASFADGSGFSKDALAWFIGPRYKDRPYLETISPRTFIGSYSGPLFVSTCTNDFIRSQALLVKSDCDSLGRKVDFVDIESQDRRVGHVHNVTSLDLPESREVNSRMLGFMIGNLH